MINEIAKQKAKKVDYPCHSWMVLMDNLSKWVLAMLGEQQLNEANSTVFVKMLNAVIHSPILRALTAIVKPIPKRLRGSDRRFDPNIITTMHQREQLIDLVFDKFYGDSLQIPAILQLLSREEIKWPGILKCSFGEFTFNEPDMTIEAQWYQQIKASNYCIEMDARDFTFFCEDSTYLLHRYLCRDLKVLDRPAIESFLCNLKKVVTLSLLQHHFVAHDCDYIPFFYDARLSLKSVAPIRSQHFIRTVSISIFIYIILLYIKI